MYKNKYIYILQEGSGGSRQTPKKFHKNQIKWRLFLKMGYAKEFLRKSNKMDAYPLRWVLIFYFLTGLPKSPKTMSLLPCSPAPQLP